jgi:hypothetical protein
MRSSWGCRIKFMQPQTSNVVETSMDGRQPGDETLRWRYIVEYEAPGLDVFWCKLVIEFLAHGLEVIDVI